MEPDRWVNHELQNIYCVNDNFWGWRVKRTTYVLHKCQHRNWLRVYRKKHMLQYFPSGRQVLATNDTHSCNESHAGEHFNQSEACLRDSPTCQTSTWQLSLNGGAVATARLQDLWMPCSVPWAFSEELVNHGTWTKHDHRERQRMSCEDPVFRSHYTVVWGLFFLSVGTPSYIDIINILIAVNLNNNQQEVLELQ